jgi:cysteine-rich repeat protein
MVRAALAGALLFAGSTVLAAVPLEMPLQGVVRDNAGNPATGDFSVSFGLYEAESGGDALWTETGDISALGGTFSTRLGATDALDPAVFAAGTTLWLGMSIEGEPELPRRALGTSAWAFHAETAAALACSGCVDPGHLSADTMDAVLQAVDDAGYPTIDAVLQAVEDAGYTKTTDLAITEDDLPANGLNEVSNGMLTTQFVHAATSPNTPFGIPDHYPDGILDSFDFPDVGTAESVTVSLHLENSKVPTLIVNLTAPDGSVYVLHDSGGVEGGDIDTTYPSPTQPVSGDLAGDWVGKNLQGPWELQVIDSDFLNNALDGQVVSWGIEVQTISNQKVAVLGDLEIQGNITGGGMSVDGDLDLLNHHLLGARFQLSDGAPVPCDEAHQGFFYLDTTSKALRVCIEGEFRSISTAICGDGVLEGDEICDDGNLATGDGCGATCAPETGYGCSGTPTSLCVTDCGDGIRAGAEACDDGNDNAGDGCSSGCEVENGWTCNQGQTSVCDTVCGDNIVAGDEECDDGNTQGGDCCSPVCSTDGGNTCCGLDDGNDKLIYIAELNACLSALGAAFSNVQWIEVAYDNTDYLDNVCQAFGYVVYTGPHGGDQCNSSANMYPSHCNQGWLGGACGNGCGNTNYDGFFCQ